MYILRVQAFRFDAAAYLYEQIEEIVQLINQLMLRVTFVTIAILLLIGQCWTCTGIGIVGPMTTTAFGCMAQQEISFAFVRVYHLFETSGRVDENARQTLLNSQEGGVSTDAYMVPCRNNDSASQINEILNEIPSDLFTSIWIKVIPTDIQECSWQGYSQYDNCIFLVETIAAIQNSNATAGVFSTYNIWREYFGETCEFVGVLFPSVYLWYAKYQNNGEVNTTRSFDDYQQFGGWERPTIKQVEGSIHINLCENPQWHAYIDMNWYES